MGVFLSLVFLLLWVNLEIYIRKKLQLSPFAKEHFQKIFARGHLGSRDKALKATFFAGMMCATFSLWEGCLWAVLDKHWGTWALVLGSLLFLTFFLLRRRDYKDNSKGLRGLDLSQALFLVAALIFLNGPIVASVFGLWLVLRLGMLLRLK